MAHAADCVTMSLSCLNLIKDYGIQESEKSSVYNLKVIGIFILDDTH